MLFVFAIDIFCYTFNIKYILLSIFPQNFIDQIQSYIKFLKCLLIDRYSTNYFETTAHGSIRLYNTKSFKCLTVSIIDERSYDQ